MSRGFPQNIESLGLELTAQAGSYLHSVAQGGWRVCQVCAAPVSSSYEYCYKCNEHKQSSNLANRTGFLIYADKPNSQSYLMMSGYKGEERLSGHFLPTFRPLLAVGLRAHFTCAQLLAGSKESMWAVVPSTRGRAVLSEIVRSLTSDPSKEVSVEYNNVPVDRRLSPDSWKVSFKGHVPEHVVVIDDAWVSGSSAQSLSIALKSAGVLEVSIFCVARVLDPRWDPNPQFIKSVLPALSYDWRVCPWTGGTCPTTNNLTSHLELNS